MSLINDALKRASQSDRNRRSQASLLRPMQPVAARPRSRTSWLLAAIIVAALCIVLAGLTFWKWWGATHPNIVTAPVQTAPKIVAEPPPPAPKPAPIIQQTPPPAAAPTPLPVVVQSPAPVPTPVPAPAVSVPEAWPITLTVKAIFYSKTRPHALVNGKTVEPGDKIDGVLVTEIKSDRVLFGWHGQSKEVLMGGE
jgi:hypothetical protein